MPTLPPSDSPVAFHEAAMLAWIHEHAPYGVITTDKAFRIQSWNRWTETHSGRTREQVVGQSLFELFPELGARGLERRFQRALDGEVSVLSTALHDFLLRMESPIHDSGFEAMQQTARIAPLIHLGQVVGTIVVIEDVTDREMQASVLRRQHQRDHVLSWALAHLLEAQEPRRTIRDLFFKVAEHYDFDAYLLYLLESDRSAFRLHAAGGISPEAEQFLSSIEGRKSISALFVGLGEARVYEHIERPDSVAVSLSQNLGLRACAVLPLATAEGCLGALCFGTRSRPTLDEGELELLSTIGKYLALALQKETTSIELGAAQATLNLHAQELERQVAERTANLRDIIAELEAFSYTLAHDLRAPIRALIGYSEALLEDYSESLPEEGKAMVGRLRRACTQLDGLTKDLLEYSRVSRQDIQLGPIDLEAVVAEIIPLVPAAPGAIQVQKPLHRVIGHRSSLQQCLANLVDNAFKFTKDGRPPKVILWTELHTASISLRSGPVSPRVTLRTEELPRVRIIVEDEGIGIPIEAHGKIFGIFERATSSLKYQGSGIGLAVVARAMTRMGGTCGVESRVGIGSKFWLELPAVDSDPARTQLGEI